MPYDKEFYYRDFVKSAAIKLDNYIKILHITYRKRNDYVIDIKDNIKFYQEAGIDITPVFKIDPTDRINTNKSGFYKLPIKLRSYLTSYNYLVYEKIPTLQRNIKTYSAINNISMEFYIPIWRGICYKIAELLLKGNGYSFGEKIGHLRVYLYKYKDSIASYNLAASVQLKKKLLAAGYTIQSPENPNGIRWKVHSEHDFCARARYKRYSKAVINANKYFFRFGWSASNPYNPYKHENDDDTFEEIIKNRSTNFLNKLLTICFNFPDLKWELYANNLDKENTKNYDEQSIICE